MLSLTKLNKKKTHPSIYTVKFLNLQMEDRLKHEFCIGLGFVPNRRSDSKCQWLANSLI